MLRILVLFLVIATSLWSQDLLVDSIDREFSGTLIKITDTYIYFQIQGETEAVQYPFWSVQRVTLADGRLAFEDGNIYVAKPTLTVEPKPGELTPTVAKPMEPLPMEARPEVESPTQQPAFVPEPAVPEPAEPEPVITAELDAGQDVSRLPTVGPKFFPIHFTLGWSIKGDGINLGGSYRFSRPIGVKVPSVLGEVMIYPVVTVGFLFAHNYNANNYSYSERWEERVTYGLVEGHWQLESGRARASLFVGAGLGRYDYYHESYDSGQGTGILISAGAQARVWRLTGDLRLYRTPGLGKFVTFANVGYQPKSFKDVLVVAGTAAAVVAVFFGIIIISFLSY